MNNMKKTLYHGSYEIVQKPRYGLGKENNDYGQGFYLTENIDIAREWAVEDGRNGFVSRYEIETDDMNILYLNAGEFSILHWLALLIDNRKPSLSSPVMAEARDWLTDKYLIDLGYYDAVIGYRADDSYFTYTRNFLSNSITLEQLAEAMNLGKLGEQFVLKSKFAFDILEFKEAEEVSSDIYYPKRKARDEMARIEYIEILKKKSIEGVYVRDLMKGGKDNAGI